MNFDPLVKKIAARVKIRDAALDFDDLMQIGRITAWRAVDTYPADHPRPLVSWVAYKVRGYLWAAARCPRPTDALDMDALPASETPDPTRMLDLSRALAAMEPRTRRIASLTLQGYTGPEIGEREGISRERVRQILADL